MQNMNIQKIVADIWGRSRDYIQCRFLWGNDSGSKSDGSPFDEYFCGKVETAVPWGAQLGRQMRMVWQ